MPEKRRTRKMMRVWKTREIWAVAHVTVEDFETTEGEEVDSYDKLMEMAGWKVTENE